MEIMNINKEYLINMSNGNLVMSALTFMGGYATENELFHQLVVSTGQQEELVEKELKRILTNGLRNGYILKKGNTYLLPSLDNEFKVDYQRKGSKSKAKKKMAAECESGSNGDSRQNWMAACQELIDVYRNNCILFRDRIFSEYFAIVRSTGAVRKERYEQLIEKQCITDPPLQKALLGLWCAANYYKKHYEDIFEKFKSVCDSSRVENNAFSKAVKPVCEVDCVMFLNRVVKELFSAVRNATDKVAGRSIAMKYKHTPKELQKPLLNLWNSSFELLQNDREFDLFGEFESMSSKGVADDKTALAEPQIDTDSDLSEDMD